ncbi:hypothetical protein FA13DRAFT_1712409 [Coprinellus micaceus]|uniref:Uncharacterized protein n=1 Tax=Coprinellus micaceus TaxID=71717 RepID=A0A4Y7T0L9_COPMI|nr:hypothetical protein FA13DRAFT_1712409 [Coprinellus micaceus]
MGVEKGTSTEAAPRHDPTLPELRGAPVSNWNRRSLSNSPQQNSREIIQFLFQRAPCQSQNLQEALPNLLRNHFRIQNQAVTDKWVGWWDGLTEYETLGLVWGVRSVFEHWCLASSAEVRVPLLEQGMLRRPVPFPFVCLFPLRFVTADPRLPPSTCRSVGVKRGVGVWGPGCWVLGGVGGHSRRVGVCGRAAFAAYPISFSPLKPLRLDNRWVSKDRGTKVEPACQRIQGKPRFIGLLPNGMHSKARSVFCVELFGLPVVQRLSGKKSCTAQAKSPHPVLSGLLPNEGDTHYVDMVQIPPQMAPTRGHRNAIPQRIGEEQVSWGLSSWMALTIQASKRSRQRYDRGVSVLVEHRPDIWVPRLNHPGAWKGRLRTLMTLVSMRGEGFTDRNTVNKWVRQLRDQKRHGSINANCPFSKLIRRDHSITPLSILEGTPECLTVTADIQMDVHNRLVSSFKTRCKSLGDDAIEQCMLNMYIRGDSMYDAELVVNTPWLFQAKGATATALYEDEIIIFSRLAAKSADLNAIIGAQLVNAAPISDLKIILRFNETSQYSGALSVAVWLGPQGRSPFNREVVRLSSAEGVESLSLETPTNCTWYPRREDELGKECHAPQPHIRTTFRSKNALTTRTQARGVPTSKMLPYAPQVSLKTHSRRQYPYNITRDTTIGPYLVYENPLLVSSWSVTIVVLFHLNTSKDSIDQISTHDTGNNQLPGPGILP